MDKETYNQIIIFAPLSDIVTSWLGLGTGFYRGAYVSNVNYDLPFDIPIRTEGTIIHEMLHGMEHRSAAIDPATPELHSYQKGNILDEKDPVKRQKKLIEWYGKYMTRKLKGGKGLHPDVFYVPNGEYTLIDNDMTTGEGVTISESARINVSECKVGKISNQKYTGKKKVPALTITDGNYTLKKGIDYTVKYTNNIKVGTAKVKITGKGIYKGTVEIEFKIVKA